VDALSRWWKHFLVADSVDQQKRQKRSRRSSVRWNPETDFTRSSMSRRARRIQLWPSVSGVARRIGFVSSRGRLTIEMFEIAGRSHSCSAKKRKLPAWVHEDTFQDSPEKAWREVGPERPRSSNCEWPARVSPGGRASGPGEASRAASPPKRFFIRNSVVSRERHLQIGLIPARRRESSEEKAWREVGPDRPRPTNCEWPARVSPGGRASGPGEASRAAPRL